MESYQHILSKLRQFTRKYYTRMLIKGGLLFIALGLLVILGMLSIEYFLWLNTFGRLLLLLCIVAVEGFLLYRFIAVPLGYLFRIKKGLSNHQASVIIGKHFPEVGDKLFNLLDLAGDSRKSELLLASIEQRSRHLDIVPFASAIKYRQSLAYAKYLIYPILLYVLIWLTGNLSDFLNSYERVVHYDLAYQPPAPFIFKTYMGSLRALENEEFTVQVETEGRIRPESVSIFINGKEYLLEEADGRYAFTFKPPLQPSEFYFSANGVRSREFNLEIVKPPVIEDFSMSLTYPDYLNKPAEVVKSTGNAVFPEGTEVEWVVKGRNIDGILLKARDTTVTFEESADIFSHKERVYKEYGYQLETSNEQVASYEVLKYRFSVIKDAFPKIGVSQVQDTLNPQLSYFVGEVSDDYGVSSVKIVWYPVNDEGKAKTLELLRPNTNLERFYYTFPSGLDLIEGKTYRFYFTVTDNDAIHNGKTSRSRIITLDKLDQSTIRNKQLEFQQEVIRKLDGTLEGMKEQKQAFEEIRKLQHEKSELSFNDQTQLRNFLEKQQRQDALMEKFSKQLQDNMEKGASDSELNEMLKERLERKELEAKRNAALLEELKKVADKIDKEELSERLEELGKQRQQNERSLEQILELTKRYYVTEKTAQLAKALAQLGEEQLAIPGREVTMEGKRMAQEEMNADFEKLEEEMKELMKDNNSLKKPLEMPALSKQSEAIKKDQSEALRELRKEQESEDEGVSGAKSNSEKAGAKQQSAGEKMKELSEALSKAGNGGGTSTITEDAEMLRQILDNLIIFSFKQEQLFKKIGKEEGELANFSEQVRDQQELRSLFEHIDDSLFSLSLRRAELSEVVNNEITEVYYNIDKALESISEDRMYQTVSYQQYVFTAANNLADFLAKLLDNMQQSLGMGSGNGENFQLPDIIKAQGALSGKLGEAGEKGSAGAEGSKGSGTGKEDGASEGKGNTEGRTGQGDAGTSGVDKGSGEVGGAAGENGLSEEELNEIYDIYKEQQKIREGLEKQLEDMRSDEDRKIGQKIAAMMEDFENELLRNGITEYTLNKMRTIAHQLLKLENAAMEQGEQQERKGRTNQESFENPVLSRPKALKNYNSDIEILNRQALPLHQIFQNKVKSYFDNND